jgi:hypothetical protein
MTQQNNNETITTLGGSEIEIPKPKEVPKTIGTLRDK